MYAQFPCLDTRGGSSSSSLSSANLKLIFPSKWLKNVFIFGELSCSDKHYCKPKATPAYCYNDICPNHRPLFPGTHFSTKPLICFVSSCPIGGGHVEYPPPPSIYSNYSVVFYCCICQCDGSISGLAFHEQLPNSSLCPSAPPLNILYAHLRGSSASYCLRGYYNDKSAHCAEKGGGKKRCF